MEAASHQSHSIGSVAMLTWPTAIRFQLAPVDHLDPECWSMIRPNICWTVLWILEALRIGVGRRQCSVWLQRNWCRFVELELLSNLFPQFFLIVRHAVANAFHKTTIQRQDREPVYEFFVGRNIFLVQGKPFWPATTRATARLCGRSFVLLDMDSSFCTECAWKGW